MVPSLSQLPVGVQGPSALELDFMRPYRRRPSPPTPNPNMTMVGRVLNERGEPETIVDDAEKWRLKMIKRMQKRIEEDVDPSSIGGTHNVSPIPPIQWENGVEVFDGSLVKVYESKNENIEVDIERAREAMEQYTLVKKNDMTSVVENIVNTDGNSALNRDDFSFRLCVAVPTLVVAAGALLVVNAAYMYYRLLEQAAPPEVPWWENGPQSTIYGTVMSSYEPSVVVARTKALDNKKSSARRLQ